MATATNECRAVDLARPGALIPTTTGTGRGPLRVLGLLGVVSVLDGHRPDFVPDDPALHRWEGWVLGQTSLPRTSPAV